jgi:hypothetical protein
MRTIPDRSRIYPKNTGKMRLADLGNAQNDAPGKILAVLTPTWCEWSRLGPTFPKGPAARSWT